MKTKLALLLLLLPVLGFAQTYTFSTLVSFPASSKKSASAPFAPIIDGSGNLYGISYYGGTFDGGTVFKVTPSGKLSVLHSFPYRTFPQGTPVRDSAGNLYGVTELGGAYDFGFIFKLSPSGKLTVLYNFPSGAILGVNSLLRDSAGNLYGYNESIAENGSLFKLTPSGEYSTLYSFCSLSDCADGSFPVGSPIMKADGNLYGVTQNGGSLGYGTVFEVTPEGKETVLYSFMGGSDGANPSARLTQDAAGNLYGTTYNGGTSALGTVFKLTPADVESVLHSFCSLSGCSDGIEPEGNVILDAAGNLYGVTSEGGINNNGVAFEITPSGEYTVIYYAAGAPGLGYALVMDKSGNLYGTTPDGGGPHNGTVYKLTKSN
jgi:uncharacterized repeat protein (TIGR03803 family)